MHPFPFKVTISIPTRVEYARGQDSTVLPDGLIASVRMPGEEANVIDRARQITGFGISRSGFIRVAAYRTAMEICKHYDRYEGNDDAEPNRDIRSPEVD